VDVVAVDEVEDDVLMLIATPPTAEHRPAASFVANRKHVVSFPITWHAGDVTSGVGGRGGCGVVGRPTNMDRATMKPMMKAKTAMRRITETVIDLGI